MYTTQLTSRQRAWLRKQAHALHPMVMVGQHGYTPNIERAVDEALAAHELVKVKFLEAKESRHDICGTIATALHAELVAVVGNIGIFFREARQPEHRQIILPKESR
jgi:RNA-binding protein